MPTRPFTVRELDDAELLAEVAMALDDDDSSDDDLFDSLVCAACEPLLKDFNQEIGPERLSVARLQREAAAQGLDGDTASRNVYNDYRFRLEDLPRVIAALDPPARFRTNSRATFSGEEGVLLMLRRLRSTAPLLDLVKESGRSITQISEAVRFMIEHVHSHHSHLIDERAFIAWEDRFADFAAALRNTGVALPNLIGFIDGKLQYVCRPGRYQHVLYSGHKRVHGIKFQGIVFPNGIQPFPYGPINGNRHDSFVLSSSGILDVLRGCANRLGQVHALFGDSAYPISPYLYRMYKGVMSAAQAMFNRDMSPLRVSVEWGFGKIVALWPFLDYRKKHQVLLAPCGLYFGVANVLTNMHTCLYGNIVASRFDMEPPTMEAYMAGGPF